jgi:hypothetical protein
MALAGAVAFPLFLWLLGPRLRRPLVVWALMLYLLALLPQLGTDAGERLLYLPYLFVSVSLALTVLDVKAVSRLFGEIPRRVGRWRRLGGWYVAVGVGGAGLVLSAILPFPYIEWARPALRDPPTAARHVRDRHRRVVFLTTRDFFDLITVPTLVEQEVGRDVDVRILSAVHARTMVERVGEASFVLTVDRRGWLTSFLAGAFRRDPRVEVGRTYAGDLFNVTVLQVTEDETDVLAARVDMHVPLDDPATLFMRWNGSAYEPVGLDTLEVGRSEELRGPPERADRAITREPSARSARAGPERRNGRIASVRRPAESGVPPHRQQPEQAEVDHGRRRQGGRGPVNGLPEEPGAVEPGIHLELELLVAPEVEVDAQASDHHEGGHDGAQDEEGRPAGPDHGGQRAHEAHGQAPQGDPLSGLFVMLEQHQLRGHAQHRQHQEPQQRGAEARRPVLHVGKRQRMVTYRSRRATSSSSTYLPISRRNSAKA